MIRGGKKVSEREVIEKNMNLNIESSLVNIIFVIFGYSKGI